MKNTPTDPTKSLGPQSPYLKNMSEFEKSGVLSTLYAVSDEVHQAFVPGRTVSLLDLGLDTLGILAVLAVLWKGRWRGIRRT